ncbi:MAG: hypothetical protein BWY71_01508 [Planctomycetes bacterium ADurb.Bin412]|nr:MAG: hypothetical protein BWY71_01508 [Planctomycetes bacterium ADurb.Bin412]
MFGRIVFITGVEFGAFPDNNSCNQAGNDRAGDAQPAYAGDIFQEKPTEQQGSQHNQKAAAVNPASQGTQQILHGRVFFRADHANSDDTHDNPDSRQNHGQGQHFGLSDNHFRAGQPIHRSDGGYAQRSRGQNRAAVAFVQVCTHAGDIPDIISDVIGNGCRIPRIVLWDAGFHFTNQVRPDVRGLGINTAADTGKQGLTAGTHTEAQHNDGNFHQIHMKAIDQGRGNFGQNQKPHGNIKQAKTNDYQPHDSSGPKGNLQAAVEAFLGTLSGTIAGEGRRFHSQKTA